MRSRSHVLGVSMSNHDRAACLLRDGRIVGAVAEERLDRRKRSEGFYGQAPRDIVIPPMAAITRLIKDAGVGLHDLDLIVCGRSRTLGRETLLRYLPVAEERVIEPAIPSHHLAHAYSAYATAPFSASAVLVIDEQGHDTPVGYEAASWFEGEGGPLRVLRRFLAGSQELSLGMVYNVFAALTGLSESGRPAPGKLMALAARGAARPDWPPLVRCGETGTDATTRLADIDAFLSESGVPIADDMEDLDVTEVDDLLAKYEPIEWDCALAADLARKAQDELEVGVLRLARGLFEISSHTSLSYAGGVALNCSANTRLLEIGWSDVFVQPAATDDGAAVGLAMYGHIEHLAAPRQKACSFDPFTGPRHSADDVDGALAAYGLSESATQPGALALDVADRLERGQVVCWFEGRSEWGPRALGGRSILASPRAEGIRDRINGDMKFREPFRPVAIAATERAAEALGSLAPLPRSLRSYMLGVIVLADDALPGIAHDDRTIRIQVVDPAIHPPRFVELVQSMEKLTGLGAVINTSFNTLGEPLVEGPEDAVRQFLLLGADALVLENRLLSLEGLAAPTRRRAVQEAWRRTAIDPIDAAIAVLRAGYRQSATRILAQANVSEKQARLRGPRALQLVQLLGTAGKEPAVVPNWKRR
jgi:carbamoyltransferase